MARGVWPRKTSVTWEREQVALANDGLNFPFPIVNLPPHLDISTTVPRVILEKYQRLAYAKRRRCVISLHVYMSVSTSAMASSGVDRRFAVNGGTVGGFVAPRLSCIRKSDVFGEGCC